MVTSTDNARMFSLACIISGLFGLSSVCYRRHSSCSVLWTLLYLCQLCCVLLFALRSLLAKVGRIESRLSSTCFETRWTVVILAVPSRGVHL